MAKTLAPYDPAPVSDTNLAGKPYHWTWRRGGFFNGKKSSDPRHNRLVLHKGLAEKCKRVHYWQDGDRA